MPVVPQSSPAWDLLAVPPTALTRFTSMNPQQSARSLYRARDTKSEQREEDLQSALLNPLAEVDGSLKVKARYGSLTCLLFPLAYSDIDLTPSYSSFGHLLRVNDQPPLPVALSKMADWAAKYYDAFLPAYVAIYHT